MSTTEIRSQIDTYLDQVDDSFLQAIYAMLETYVSRQADEIVGYHPGGTPITAADLDKSIDISEKQIENGETYTIEEVRKEAEGWLNTK